MTPTGITATRMHRQTLLDAYGALLTERQREALRLQLEEDWSISELAAAMGSSRAAAHDLIHRGLQRMEDMEANLGLCRRLADAEQQRQRLERRVRSLQLQLARVGGRA